MADANAEAYPFHASRAKAAGLAGGMLMHAVQHRAAEPKFAFGRINIGFELFEDDPGVIEAVGPDGVKLGRLGAKECAEISAAFSAMSARLHAETAGEAPWSPHAEGKGAFSATSAEVAQPGALDIPARPAMPVEERATPFSRPEGNEF